MANQIKTFTFDINSDGWVFTQLVGATGIWVSTALETSSEVGRNKVDNTSYWEWTGTFEDLGAPAGSIINGYSSCSLDYSCTSFTVMDVVTSGPFTINDGTLRTLVAGATISGSPETGTPTQSGTITGLSLASSTSVVLRITCDFDNGNDNAAGAVVELDNVKITMDYTAGGGFEPAWAINGNILL